MSRVGNNPNTIPEGVSVEISENKVFIKGRFGEIEQEFSGIVIKMGDGVLNVERNSDSKDNKSKHGLYRALINNMVTGVSKGWEKKLLLVGVGYRAKADKLKLELVVGYSHPVNFKIPEGITIETPSQTEIVISGIDKQKVGQVAADIRSVRPPEPYKGKGIKYSDEQIVKKEAKKK